MVNKLNDELRGQIARAIAAGCTLESAAFIAGITSRTLHAWLERGRAGRRTNTPHSQLLRDVEEARGRHEAVLLASLNRAAGNGSWRAAAFVLERRYPERWAARPRDAQGDGTISEIDPLDALDEVAQRRDKKKV